ncbi:MAG: leucyl/phenylalanyl-tRNA--protein transferase [Acidobacteriota bacterium]
MLSAEALLTAYASGIFPMAMEDGEIGWFAPNPRALIPLDERFHVSRTLRKTIASGQFETTVDTCFERVIAACGDRRDGTWISEEIAVSYVNLHRLGHAHSLEVWVGERLAGGLYGVHLGAAFFGESMFHTVTDASKVALVALVERLRARGFQLLDTQWKTAHLERFGAYEIPRSEYLRRLRKAITVRCRFA